MKGVPPGAPFLLQERTLSSLTLSSLTPTWLRLRQAARLSAAHARSSRRHDSQDRASLPGPSSPGCRGKPQSSSSRSDQASIPRNAQSPGAGGLRLRSAGAVDNVVTHLVAGDGEVGKKAIYAKGEIAPHHVFDRRLARDIIPEGPGMHSH